MSGMTFGTNAGNANAQGDMPGAPGTASDAGDVPMRSGPNEQTEEQRAIVKKAKKFYEKCNTWESTFRARFVDDLKFAEADAYNNYQWPNSVRRLRDIDDRPCITVNKTRMHNLQVINDAKQNKPEPRIRPVGGEASLESAEAMEGIVRHIQYRSKFSTILDQASSFQVRAGFGVYRIATDYADDDTMDQDIFIRPIIDPLSVMFDPDAKLADKSDGKMALIFDNIPRDEFEDIYPEYKDFSPARSISASEDSWIGQDYVRICEFFYKTSNTKKLIKFTDPTDGKVLTMREDHIPKVILDMVTDDPATQSRLVQLTEVRHVVIIGDSIAEENVWLGKYIPLIPVIGEETIIDGIMDRKGHTRALIDPQRMYNYWASAAVEFGALQTKTPWIAPAAAVEGHEPLWNSANKQNVSVLIFNHMDDEGNEIPAPVRPQLPEQAPLYMSGMQTTQLEMMMVSGQYQTQMGQQGNERSGKAIQERQRQGDNATYHFINNQAIAVRLTGEIILDLIPKIYNSPRVLQMLAKNGKDSLPVKIDPDGAQAWAVEQGEDQKIAQRILNPAVGKYDVQADIGPAYGTAREEAFAAMTQILTQAPEMTTIIGDILLKNADFPGAEEASRRMERMVPAQAKSGGPTKEEAQLQEELQKTNDMLKVTMQELAVAQLKLVGKGELRDIDVYKAESERLNVMAKANMVDPEAFGVLMRQFIADAVATHISKISAMPADSGYAAPPAPQVGTATLAPNPASGGTPLPPGSAQGTAQ